MRENPAVTRPGKRCSAPAVRGQAASAASMRVPNATNPYTLQPSPYISRCTHGSNYAPAATQVLQKWKLSRIDEHVASEAGSETQVGPSIVQPEGVQIGRSNPSGSADVRVFGPTGCDHPRRVAAAYR